MPSYSKPPRIEISDEQASDFLEVIRDALKRMSKTEIEDVRLIVRKRQAITISFDKNKRPFLGFSASYNPPSNRVMLANDNWLINKCKFWFIVRRKSLSGGRFFIQSQRAFTDPKNTPEIVLCEWDWPGQDVVEACMNLLEDAHLTQYQ